ncbi:MAG: DUF2059 domain-containing protein [Spirochaetales bacterium]|nr:DUF2059 domain-containing protein [Spirochaetales bacterium]
MNKIIVVLLLVSCCFFSFSDENSHYKAAERLLALTISEESYNSVIEQSIDTQIDANPQIADFRQIMLDYMYKYMSLSAIKEDLIQLYMEYFTEKEILEMEAFYMTDVGKKASKLLPEMFKRGTQLGQQKVQENMGELQQAIADAINDKE